MHQRQKIGIGLGALAAVICGGHILLSIRYAGDLAILASWRDQPPVSTKEHERTFSGNDI